MKSMWYHESMCKNLHKACMGMVSPVKYENKTSDVESNAEHGSRRMLDAFWIRESWTSKPSGHQQPEERDRPLSRRTWPP